MNIGFEAKRLFTNYTGLGNYSRFIVHALSSHIPSEYFLFTPREISNSETLPITKKKNVHVLKPERIHRIFPALWRTWGLSFNNAVRSLDIFHGLSAELPFGLPPSVKKIVTVHDLIFLRFPEFYSAIDTGIYKAKVKSACSRADKIIAISQQTAEDLMYFLNVDQSRIAVVYQGCHPDFTRVLSPDEILQVRRKYNLPVEYILNVGTIEARKNLMLLVKGLSRLKEKDRTPIVVIGRPTPYMNEVIATAEKAGVSDNLIFLKNLPFTDFPAVYQGARVFVYPSLFEGFGIPIIEAIASGVPVITSKGSCFSEAGGPHCRYIDPNDPEDLANSLMELLSDSGLRKNMAAQSRNYIAKFASAQIAKDLYSVYTGLNY